MTKPWFIPKVSTARSLPIGELPKNAHERVGWLHMISAEASNRSLQVGTPVFMSTRPWTATQTLCTYKQVVMTKPWLIPKISTARSLPTGPQVVFVVLHYW